MSLSHPRPRDLGDSPSRLYKYPVIRLWMSPSHPRPRDLGDSPSRLYKYPVIVAIKSDSLHSSPGAVVLPRLQQRSSLLGDTLLGVSPPNIVLLRKSATIKLWLCRSHTTLPLHISTTHPVLIEPCCLHVEWLQGCSPIAN